MNLINQLELATLPQIDQNRPSQVETATFALGWFWGPDAQFGSLPGVIRTRVGYTGGTKLNPTYYSLGNHTESLQIDYDPSIISFEEILSKFWQSHEPTARAWSSQYKAALFFHNQEQQDAAVESKTHLAENKKGRFLSRNIHTEILPAQEFYLAEDYHQKYMLRRAQTIWDELMQIYPEMMDWVNSTAAARLNGYVGRYGTSQQIEDEIESLGLSNEAQSQLQQIVRGRW